MWFIVLIFGVLIIVLISAITVQENDKKYDEVKTSSDKDSFDRERERVAKKLEQYKKGSRVVAQNKKGIWEHGEIIGESDWSLFTLFFIVKFDNGEIEKISEGKVSLV